MKGVRKCFGLLLVFAIMLGLSLNVSSDVSALKYPISTIPFGRVISDTSINSHPFGSPLYDPFEYVISSNFTWSGTPRSLNYFNLSGNSSSCSVSSVHTLPSVTTSQSIGGSRYRYSFLYYDTDLFVYNNSHVVGGSASDLVDIARCNPLYEIPDLPASAPDSVLSLFPYRYEYNGLFVRDTSDSDGFVKNTKLEFSDLFESDSSTSTSGNMPYSFKSINLPLGIFSDSSELHTGNSVSVRGSFMFDSDDPENDLFQIGQGFNMNFYYNALAKDQISSTSFASDSRQCSYNVIDNRSNSSEYPWELTFSCYIPLDLTRFENNNWTPVLGFNLSLTSTDSLWDYPATNFLFEDFYFVTNNDLTPAGKSFSDYTISGNYSTSAPGSAVLPSVSQDGINFTSSLANLFNFGFFNPFQPIFNLFADNSQCAQIPTISSWLHSSDTQVCPWFPSSVRNVLTPVFGLSSSMLIFGFAVRWLGSSSGNFFDDSEEHSAGSYKVRARGVIKR